MDKCGIILTRIIRSKYKVAINRYIMTTPGLAKEATEELEKNPYFEKYAEKIAKLQQTSPEEFLSRVETQQKQKTKPKFGEGEERKYSSLFEPKKDITYSADLENDEPLHKIMKIELILDEDSDKIKKIWEEYHKQKDVIAATIPSNNYEVICAQAKKYPIFLFPIPRSQGYEFIMCQFHRNTVHFTPLLCYQVHKENAPECLTITHYTEFKDSKGIVLMRGEFDKNVVNAKEAQCLANQLQLYYGRKDPGRLELLERFTRKPDEFKHMDLIKNIENLTL